MLFVEWVEETKDFTKKVVKGIIEQSGRITLSVGLNYSIVRRLSIS